MTRELSTMPSWLLKDGLRLAVSSETSPSDAGSCIEDHVQRFLVQPQLQLG